MTFDAQPAGLARSQSLRELGRGGRTIVELIFDPARDHVVACKRWSRASAETRFRLKQQFRQTSQVNHPNVVRLYDLLIEPDETCLIMEAIDGTDAAEYLASAVAPDTSDTRFVATALRLLRQLTEALLTLHVTGIVHRDVKPRNVLVEPNGRLVLLDAGFAWPPEEPFAPLGEYVARDTLPYLAPECLRGALPSVEADWYGFGAVAFALLAGRAPFEGLPAALLRVKDRPIASLCEMRPSIPLALDDLVRALLQRDPHARPTGAEVEALLADLSHAEPFDVTTHAWPIASTTAPATPATNDEDERPTPRESGLTERVVTVTREIEPHNDNAQPLDLAADGGENEAPTAGRDRAQEVAGAIRDFRAALEQDEDAQADSVPPELIVSALAGEFSSPEALDENADVADSDEDRFFLPDGPSLASELSGALGETQELALASTGASNAAISGGRADYDVDRSFDATDLSDESATLELPLQAGGVNLLAASDSGDEPAFLDGLGVSGEAPGLVWPPLDLVDAGADRADPALVRSNRETSDIIDQAIAEATNADHPRSDLNVRPLTSTAPSGNEPPSKYAADTGREDFPWIDAPTRAHPDRALADRVSTLLESADEARVICLRGAAASDRSTAFGVITERLEQRGGWLVLSANCDEHGDPYEPFHSLLAQLSTRDQRYAPYALEPHEANALARMFPELTELTRGATLDPTDLARDPQRQCIDAFCALRKVLIGLAGQRRVLFLLRTWHALQPDAIRLMHCLLAVEPRPRIDWLLASADPGALPETLSSLLDRVRQHNPVHLIEAVPALDETSSHAQEREASAEFATLRPQLDVMLQAAESATERLALQRAAEWQRRALELSSSAELIHASAVADSRAGRLRDAAQTWLQLARTSPEASDAQRYELAAGVSLLRAGDEERGRALLDDVLRVNGERRPRLPLMASAFERARLIWQQKSPKGPLDPASSRRFDALWAAAKELALLDPTASDALASRALRQTQRFDDPSRALWALGFEACCEANVGGAYLRGRARNMCIQTAVLAATSGEAYDRAYATSVPAIVAWFSGEWSRAETLLRDGLRQYGRATLGTAHEQDVLSSFLVAALEAQGKIAALNKLLPELRIAAQQSGHQLAEALCTLYETGLPALAADRPLQAIARADALLAGLPGDAFGPLHFQHFVATASARLYAGHSAQAFQQTEQTWRRLRRGFWPHLDAIAVMLHQLRARAALALAAVSAPAEAARLCKLAAAQADALGRSSLPHAAALRFLIDANLAAVRGDGGRAHVLCREAAVAFDRAGMPLLREVCKAARGALTHTDQVSQEAASSLARLRQLGVHEPRTMTAAWFPSLRRALTSQ
jgi:serine/threonine protein kinase